MLRRPRTSPLFPYTPLSRLAAEVMPLEARLDLMRRADDVVIATPLTPETRGLIGRAEIAAMKPTATLINLGRGPVIDEEDRKSTRLNSSHGYISYAVFCLKK